LFKQKKYDEIIEMLKKAYKANNLPTSYVDKDMGEIFF
jgi:hypothetical protein